MPKKTLPGIRRILVLAATAGALIAAPASAATYTVDATTTWKSNAAPMGWSASLDRVIYNVRGGDGMFDVHSARPDGSDATCLTCGAPVLPGAGANTHRGAGDVNATGDLMLLAVERGRHFGSIGAVEAEPGKGAYSDVWLARTDGSQFWPLTDIYAPGSDAMGTMWPRFDRTGTRLVWAELYGPAIANLGSWRLKRADIVWTDGAPHLENVRTYQPESNRFFEPYGFSPDNRRIIFASDMGMPNWYDSQIFTVDADFTGPAQRLSPSDPKPGFFTNYNEFATYVPEGDHILYGRTAYTSNGGIDYWIMQPDGGEQQRLTYYNSYNHPQSLGRYVAMGGMAFDPHNPNRFVAGASADASSSTIDALMVTMRRDGRLGETTRPPSGGFTPGGAPPKQGSSSDGAPSAGTEGGGGSAPSRAVPRGTTVTVPRQTLRGALRAGGFVVRVTAAGGGRAAVTARVGRRVRGRGASPLGPDATVRVVARASRTSLRHSAGKRVRLTIDLRVRGAQHAVLHRTLRLARR